MLVGIFTHLNTLPHEHTHTNTHTNTHTHKLSLSPSHTLTRIYMCMLDNALIERWGAGVETQKNVRGEIGGWGRVPFNEPYAPSLSTIYDGA